MTKDKLKTTDPVFAKRNPWGKGGKKEVDIILGKHRKKMPTKKVNMKHQGRYDATPEMLAP